MHDAPQDVLTEAYPEEEFWQDLKKVTGGRTNEQLARLAIRESSRCRDWMRKHGVHFQPSLSGTLHLSRTNAFFLGGGAPPLPFLGFIPSWFWFLSKILAMQFCFLWFRWTFPRFRVDRLMDYCWKFLLPWSLANILLAGAYLL